MRRTSYLVADITIFILLLIASFALTVPAASGTDRDPLIATDTIPFTVPPSPDYTDPEAVESLVRDFFVDNPVMVQIARCESTYRHFLPSGEVLRGHVDSRDTGVMQINTYYHQDAAEALGLDLENIHDNLRYAQHLYNQNGTRDWSASEHCWSG